MANLIQQQQVQGLENALTGTVGHEALWATGTILESNLTATGTTLSGIDVFLLGRINATGTKLAEISDVASGRMDLTGTTLVNSINTVAANLLMTGTQTIAMSGNLQTAIRNTGLNILSTSAANSGDLQTYITQNTAKIELVSGITVIATGIAFSNENIITGSNARTLANEVNTATVSGITNVNNSLIAVLSGNVNGIENTLTGKYDASGNAISGTLNLRLVATGAALSGLASETRLYQTGTVANRLGPLNDNRAATLGYTNYSADIYGETMINAGATQITTTRVLQWGGDLGPYKTGELFLARSSQKRAYVPPARTWFVKMYGTMKDIDAGATRGNAIYNLAGYETGFVVDHAADDDGLLGIRVNMGGTSQEDVSGVGDWLGSGIIIQPFMTGFGGTKVLGVSGVNPSATSVRFRVTAIVTENDNTTLV